MAKSTTGRPNNIAKNKIVLNKGAQFNFVQSMALYSAYMGGVGAGKTFAGAVKLVKAASQPKVPGEAPPISVMLSVSVPVVRDIAENQFNKILAKLGVNAKYKVNDRKYVLETGGEIWFRGLDEPQRIRGIECVAFDIDEGRNFKDKSGWDVMVGRLRQGVGDNIGDEDLDDYHYSEKQVWVPGENYYHQGFVTSTPHGYDWMYDLFHPESQAKYKLLGAEWYNAPTHDNRRNLPRGYIPSLEQTWHGKFYEQEVLGLFVGAIAGAVFKEFNSDVHVEDFVFNPELPLYSFWDFGIGDAGVCTFAQLAWREVFAGGMIHKIPHLYILDAIEMTDAGVTDWANAYYKWLASNTEGREPVASWGDPAGGQRNTVTKTSILRELGQRGIKVRPAPRAPIDEGLIILQNMMEGDQFHISSNCNERMIQAVRTYRWKVDDNGLKLSDKPVHDWTSHFCDTLRYGALGLIGMNRKSRMVPSQETRPGTIDYIMEQLQTQDEGLVQLGNESSVNINWHPDEQVGLKGLL